jgi:hypothetical protein
VRSLARKASGKPEDQEFCIQRSFGYTTYPAFASDGTL